MNKKQENEILIYQAEDGSAVTEVRLGEETVWLSQAQIAALFDRERSVITKHINNVFKDGELNKESNVQNLHIAGSDKPVRFFNLNVIISVGYRVKSLRGTQFSIWANKVLKDYLINGYALNEKRLQEQNQKLSDLRATVSLLEQTLAHQTVGEDEAKGLVKFSKHWNKLNPMLRTTRLQLASLLMAGLSGLINESQTKYDFIVHDLRKPC